jgi:hypothetical protein
MPDGEDQNPLRTAFVRENIISHDVSVARLDRFAKAVRLQLAPLRMMRQAFHKFGKGGDHTSC